MANWEVDKMQNLLDLAQKQMQELVDEDRSHAAEAPKVT
jgi:hypothetical protein